MPPGRITGSRPGVPRGGEIRLPRQLPVLALDVGSLADARALVERVGDGLVAAKVGLELFTACGPAVVAMLREAGVRVFLDLKLHDIPRTVAGAVRAATRLEVDWLTVHASGGAEMLRAAREARDEAGGRRPALLAVTVLTSHTGASLGAAWGGGERLVAVEVERLAGMADEAGTEGLVCAVHEVARLRRRPGGERLLLATPGLRRGTDPPDDQRRTATCAEAVRVGSDLLVVGRTVTRDPDPGRAFREVLREIDQEGNASSAGM